MSLSLSGFSGILLKRFPVFQNILTVKEIRFLNGNCQKLWFLLSVNGKHSILGNLDFQDLYLTVVKYEKKTLEGNHL